MVQSIILRKNTSANSKETKKYKDEYLTVLSLVSRMMSSSLSNRPKAVDPRTEGLGHKRRESAVSIKKQKVLSTRVNGDAQRAPTQSTNAVLPGRFAAGPTALLQLKVPKPRVKNDNGLKENVPFHRKSETAKDETTNSFWRSDSSLADVPTALMPRYRASAKRISITQDKHHFHSPTASKEVLLPCGAGENPKEREYPG